ncbi:hypothetical protein SBV1_3520005 [Verrucomicrobia bacterium]|nr:hypothetical protein SBV1_3520005 [Verrucomicrobiota bacterium]
MDFNKFLMFDKAPRCQELGQYFGAASHSGICRWLRRTFLGGLLVLYTQAAPGLTLEQLKSDKNLTPERLIRQFADFKFELGRTVRQPEVFLERRAGDCDDFATLAAGLLRARGYTTRLVVVFMPNQTHVVCYVEEIKGYLDFNRRKEADPVVKCEDTLAAMGASVAQSFRSEWRSASEYSFLDGKTNYLATEFR